jgi:hypothetical protein
MKSYPRSLAALALLASCMTDPTLSEHEATITELTATLSASIDEDTTALVSCPSGETLVAGSATCTFTLNAATPTGVSSLYSPNVGNETCFCSMNADCGFNDKSTVCVGGSLAIGESYPCGGPDTKRGGPIATLDKTQFSPLDKAGCEQACTTHYNSLTQAQKNAIARGICENGIPIASGNRDPISCCIP